ncbi:50S ribosomal protein L20-like [Homarus americanus]|uniref:Large ribosomal subunit protein bL20m n=1 Tax=Homarus americanus TaxID=6706 RepID=A0A8J5JYL4_HOMAM|nr:50S ribosomal protein L20-like [Homarus americanus]KAG7166006.1 39S ribosomal protein L20-like [Homarus americanus]
MVITSPTLFARARGGDRYWKRRRILALSSHFFGRKQNCYSIAIKYVHRALRYGVRARKLKKADDRELWDTRINAGCFELGTKYSDMKAVMNDTGIALDRKILQNMAVWEPRSFRALASLTKVKQAEMGLNTLGSPPPSGVVTRGML